MAKHNKPGADQDWWTIWPEVFDAELAAFARLGIEPRTVYKGNGILILEADWPVDGQSAPMLLRIGYSPLHPFFRPAVAAPNESFERHQNPISRELCLLTQESGQWDSNQLVADFVQERLNHLLRALAARSGGPLGRCSQARGAGRRPVDAVFRRSFRSGLGHSFRRPCAAAARAAWPA
ncbi:hypothetical protein [Bradyrhizobium sp. USDA 4503]